MKPERFFHEVYGPGVVYSGFITPGAGRWLPNQPGQLLSLSGSQLAVAGDMHMLCAAGSATEPGLELLVEAGFVPPSNLHIFLHEQDYLIRLGELRQAGMRVVVQHVHPVTLLPAEACWIPPGLLSWLNDKGSLAELVPPAGVPRRIVFKPDVADWHPPGLSFPFLLKAATLLSTGGGSNDLYICRDTQDLAPAARALQASQRIVAEEWLSAQRFLCLNYGVDPDAHVDYLGAAQIIADPRGGYCGNWLGELATPSLPGIDLGRQIAELGARRGYRGYLCVDIAELVDGRVLAYDLNFRVCGSTAALLVFDAVRKATGASVAKFRNWSFDGPHRELAASARRAMRAGFLVPLSSFDPQVHGLDGPAKISGLLLGGSTEEVVRREAELERLGWH